MVTIEKTFGVKDAADDAALTQIQQVIASASQQFGWVGKAVIDPEKITFYKFGIKLGLARLSVAGLVVNEQGVIRYTGLRLPVVMDREILTNVYILFGKRCPI